MLRLQAPLRALCAALEPCLANLQLVPGCATIATSTTHALETRSGTSDVVSHVLSFSVEHRSRSSQGASTSTATSLGCRWSTFNQRHAAGAELLSTRLYAKTSAKTVRAPAASLVSPESPLLIHYKRRISGNQLTFRLGKRTSAAELRDAILLYQTHFDPISLAAAMTQLYRCQGQDRDFNDSTAHQVLELLDPILQRQMRWFNIRSASTLLWAFASLSPSARSTGIRDATLVELLQKATNNPQKLPLTSPRRYALTAWAAAKLVGSADVFLPGHVQPTAPGGTSLKTGPLAEAVAEAAARLRDVAAPRVHHLSTQGMATLAWGLGSLKALDATLASILAKEAIKRTGNLAFEQPTSRDILGLLGSLAASGHAKDNTQLFGHVAAVLTASPEALMHWRPNQLAHLASTYAAARVKHEGLLTAATEALMGKLHHSHSWVLPEFKAACSKLGFSHPQL
mmetsp:Transcript_8168/g.17510  ORF Transcript_8168/g.17510 Transcript_8168/m.17510 type:complete len:456 (+) Transcript_8168:27-1394(+)